MITITLPRAVVEQALEALEFPAVSFPVDRHKAAVALRAALAQERKPLTVNKGLPRKLPEDNDE